MVSEMDQTKRERVVDLIRKMRGHTVENGCTPGEAAKFAAKAAELLEQYQIEEAEVRAADKGTESDELEVCQNTLRTGKRVFNPGMTQVVAGLAQGMCCQVILLHQHGEAVYGIVGEQMDADYVCQLSTSLVPALRVRAMLEGVEHGYEKAGLVRWCNQYLTGAGMEIRKRLEDERRARSEARVIEHRRTSTALVLVTGETLAIEKKAAADDLFKKLYPRTRKTQSRSEFIGAAHDRGRAAGREVGLNVGLE